MLQHYLSFLNNLRVREYCTAMESAYAYFDRRNVLVTSSTTSASRSKSKNEASETVRTSQMFRYAALNLATLHFQFGHRWVAWDV